MVSSNKVGQIARFLHTPLAKMVVIGSTGITRDLRVAEPSEGLLAGKFLDYEILVVRVRLTLLNSFDIATARD